MTKPYEPSSLRSNRLLDLLSPKDSALLHPHLEPVDLMQNQVCIEPDVPIASVYFLDGGMGSTVMPDENGSTSEIGTQGFEGLIGIPVILGADRTPHKTFMQVSGPARRIGVEHICLAIERSSSLRRVLQLYAHVFLLQVGQTAYANARYKVEERLARWVLMAADRLGSPVSLTHEFLSYMLGVRRSSVTTATHVLEGEGLIKATRSSIEIRNRAGLEARAGGCYGLPEREYERLIGPWR